jgi:hypothetical protein
MASARRLPELKSALLKKIFEKEYEKGRNRYAVQKGKVAHLVFLFILVEIISAIS